LSRANAITVVNDSVFPSKRETEMAEYRHDHPGEAGPRAHGATHHQNRIVDLNTAPEREIADLPVIGAERAKALRAARPFKSWQDVEKLPGFGPGMIDDLKSGGAQIGSIKSD